jgi:hypothetical protein
MAYPILPLINGKAYEWADIALNILGTQFFGVTAIEYGETQDMKNIMGAGRYANSRTYGQIEATASITLLMSEVEALQSVAPNGRIQDIPEFDIPVAYLDDRLTTVRHVLKNVRFTNNMRSSEPGNNAIETKIDLIISHVQFA